MNNTNSTISSTTLSTITSTISSLNTTSTSVPIVSTMFPPTSTTTLAPNMNKPKDSVIFLVALLSAVSFLIIFVSVMLFYLRKKRLDKLRHQLMPFYSFDPNEEDGDWESELLDDNSQTTGITRRVDYKSVEITKANSRQL